MRRLVRAFLMWLYFPRKPLLDRAITWLLCRSIGWLLRGHGISPSEAAELLWWYGPVGYLWPPKDETAFRSRLQLGVNDESWGRLYSEWRRIYESRIPRW